MLLTLCSSFAPSTPSSTGAHGRRLPKREKWGREVVLMQVDKKLWEATQEAGLPWDSLVPAPIPLAHLCKVGPPPRDEGF